MSIIGDVGTLLLGISAAGAFVTSSLSYWQSRRNGRKSDTLVQDVAVIKVQTDGINKQLVEVTGKAALAEGTAAGIVEGHAAGLDQGRNEERKAPV